MEREAACRLKVTPPVLRGPSYTGGRHKSKLLQVFWVWVSLFKIEGVGWGDAKGRLRGGVNAKPPGEGRWLRLLVGAPLPCLLRSLHLEVKFGRKGSENAHSPSAPLLCPPVWGGGGLAPGTGELLSDRETAEGTEENEVGLPAIAGAFDEKFSSGLLLAIFKDTVGLCSLTRWL